MELRDTVKAMLSDDYQRRLLAEYCQLVIRYKKLQKKKRYFIDRGEDDLYYQQAKIMLKYIEILEKRAIRELDRMDLPNEHEIEAGTRAI